MKFYFKKDAKDEDKYNIFNDSHRLYEAIFNTKDNTTNLMDHFANIILIGKMVYSFEIFNDNFRVFVSSKFWFFPIYYFEFQDNFYEIIMHRGAKYSFYKNDMQIGTYILNSNLKDYWDMKLECNQTEPYELLLLICLYIHSEFFSEPFPDEFGFNIWFQKKKFNKNWNPL